MFGLRSNIGRTGRWLRLVMGVGFLVLAVALARLGGPVWVVILVAGGGVFALFESAAGWCLARACGIKTRI
jgi:hypothetical protein